MNENMAIELVEATEMRTGRGGGGKGKSGQKYAKYRTAIQNALPFLKESIAEKETIRMKVDDVKKEMGKDFVSKHATSLYWGLKYVLFNEGIWVTTGKHNDGSDMFVMRNATPDDKLPDSLQKGLNKETGKDEGKEDDLLDIDIDIDEDEDVNEEDK